MRDDPADRDARARVVVQAHALLWHVRNRRYRIPSAPLDDARYSPETADQPVAEMVRNLLREASRHGDRHAAKPARHIGLAY